MGKPYLVTLDHIIPDQKDLKRGRSDHYCFENGGKGHEPRNVVGSRSWEQVSGYNQEETGTSVLQLQGNNSANSPIEQKIDSSLEPSEGA